MFTSATIVYPKLITFIFAYNWQEREKILSDHRLKTLLDLHTNVTASLKELYEDKDGERKNEVAALSGPNEFAEFYNRLKQIKEFYKKHPNEISVPLQVEFDEMSKTISAVNIDNPESSSLLVEFSDEEGFGRYLDLHECYNMYLNIRGVEKTDYINYLMTFDHVFDIPKERKNMEYKKYLETLNAYLYDFIQRVRPLIDMDSEMEQVQIDFKRQWDSG